MAAALGARKRTALAGGYRLSQHFHDDARLAGAGITLDQRQIGSREATRDRIALDLIQIGVNGLNRAGPYRLQFGSGAVQQRGEKRSSRCGRRSFGGGQFMGEQHPVLRGSRERSLALGNDALSYHCSHDELAPEAVSISGDNGAARSDEDRGAA